MATTSLRGNPVNTVGDLPAVGQPAPSFVVTGPDLADISSADLDGVRTVLNIFPSVGTAVCAMSVRKFNELAASLDNTKIICVSADLPFALGQFCGAEGIENVSTASVFRSSFGEDYGVLMVDGPMRGLLARSVIVVDVDGKVLHSQLVPNIGQEPDYDAAIAALG